MARQYGKAVNATPPNSGLASLVWVIPVLVGFSSVAVLAVAFGKWRSGRVIEVSDQDLEIADSLRERD